MKPSPTNRGAEGEEAEERGSSSSGGFVFRTPLKSEVPTDFKWADAAEREAYEKLARIGGAAAADRLLAKNPHTPPSKLLARVTMAAPSRQEAATGVGRKAAAGAGGAVGRHSTQGGDGGRADERADLGAMTPGEARRRCSWLKDNGNAFFSERKWKAAVDAYAEGAKLATQTLGADYDATQVHDDGLVALAHVASVLYSNGANALEKLARRQEALQCCHRALALKADNGKAAVRGAQCAMTLGLFAESVPLYRAAIKLGFSQLKADLARAERMREDLRTAADLVAQENGERAKVCLKDARAAAPESIAVLKLAVQAHLLCREFQEARSSCQQLMSAVHRHPRASSSEAAASLPSNAWLAVQLARAACGLGDLDGVCSACLALPCLAWPCASLRLPPPARPLFLHLHSPPPHPRH